MRIDKYLKVSRVIKRRTIAQEACDAGRVSVNGKVIKPSFDIKVDDIVTIKFGDRPYSFKVLSIIDSTKKADATNMFEIIEGQDES